jgi:hypothetical protein
MDRIDGHPRLVVRLDRKLRRDVCAGGRSGTGEQGAEADQQDREAPSHDRT